MSNKHLQREPHAIRGTTTAWWYEEEKGMTVVQERGGDGRIGGLIVLIPWASIRAALARKDKR